MTDLVDREPDCREGEGPEEEEGDEVPSGCAGRRGQAVWKAIVGRPD